MNWGLSGCFGEPHLKPQTYMSPIELRWIFKSLRYLREQVAVRFNRLFVYVFKEFCPWFSEGLSTQTPPGDMPVSNLLEKYITA